MERVRIDSLGTSTSPGNAQELREVELAAGSLGVKVQYVNVLSPRDMETAFQTAVKGRADAVLMMVAGPATNPQRKEIVELAVKSRLPVTYESARSVATGGLMSYGVNLLDSDRAPPYMWTRSSKAPSPPSCRWSSRQNLSSPST